MIGHVVVPGVDSLIVDLRPARATHLHQQPRCAGIKRERKDTSDILLSCSTVFFNIGDIKAVDQPMCRVVETRTWCNDALVKRRRYRQRFHGGPWLNGVRDSSVLEQT